MKKFYRHKETKEELVVYKNISNGVILTKFDEKTGTPICNESYQEFVTKEFLEKEFELFPFKMASSYLMDSVIARHLPEIVNQMDNYGIAETQSRNLKEFYHHSPTSLDLYRDAVKSDNVELKDYYGGDDDDFYWSEAEDLFPFIHLGLIPILKKMVIELTEERA